MISFEAASRRDARWSRLRSDQELLSRAAPGGLQRRLAGRAVDVDGDRLPGRRGRSPEVHVGVAGGVRVVVGFFFSFYWRDSF